MYTLYIYLWDNSYCYRQWSIIDVSRRSLKVLRIVTPCCLMLLRVVLSPSVGESSNWCSSACGRS